MKAVSTIRPASIISFAASPARRIFSTRSAAVKPRSLLRPEPDIVAVEQEGVAPARVELRLDQIGDGRFAGAGEAGEPEQFRLLLHQRGAALRR